MKLTKSGHKKVRFNEKVMKEKLMKKAYNYMVWWKKQHKNLRFKLVASENENMRNI